MAFTQDELKQQVAKAAIEYVKSGIIGVGRYWLHCKLLH